MCGIVGYIGAEAAAPIILDGLSKLEYRGYDSAGMAVLENGKIKTQKAAGRLKVLEILPAAGRLCRVVRASDIPVGLPMVRPAM